MKAAICAVLACVVGVAVAQGGLGGGPGNGGNGLGDGGEGGDGGQGWGWAPPKYKYNYGVKDGWTKDIKHAEEHREGGWTQGSYSLLQPDGLTRTVKYTVSPKGGFQAKVTYSGWGHNGLGDGAGFGGAGNGAGFGGVGNGAGLGGAGVGGARGGLGGGPGPL